MKSDQYYDLFATYSALAEKKASDAHMTQFERYKFDAAKKKIGRALRRIEGNTSCVIADNEFSFGVRSTELVAKRDKVANLVRMVNAEQAVSKEEYENTYCADALELDGIGFTLFCAPGLGILLIVALANGWLF